MSLYEKKFDENAKSSSAWLNKSSDLLRSAHVLWKAMENNDSAFYCWSTYKMLMGMSFELLFKAISIQKQIEFDYSHILSDLSQSAKVSLTEGEVSILNVLTEYIVWDGKYPNPKDKRFLEQHWKNENKVSKDSFKIGNLEFQKENDKLGFDSLVELWRKCLDAYDL